MQDKMMNCADCYLQTCNTESENYPKFCASKKYLDYDSTGCLNSYIENEEDHKIALVSSELVMDNYGKLDRIQEIIEFAKRLEFKKIGIATCVGLIEESRILTNILRTSGFEVVNIGCKVGEISRADIGIKASLIKKQNNPLCNPILQAKLLNDEKTQLNVIVGLCVGHDSLFTKYADAICTTAIVKDRVHSNNPSKGLYAK